MTITKREKICQETLECFRLNYPDMEMKVVQDTLKAWVDFDKATENKSEARKKFDDFADKQEEPMLIRKIAEFMKNHELYSANELEQRIEV